MTMAPGYYSNCASVLLFKHVWIWRRKAKISLNVIVQTAPDPKFTAGMDPGRRVGV